MNNLSHIMPAYIPKMNTKAFALLDLLLDLEEHPTIEIMNKLGSDPRSALQQLKGERFGFWNIHNVGDLNGIYQLDVRHLKGDPVLDQLARHEREYEFRKDSFEQAVSEASREAAALQKLIATGAMQYELNFKHKK